MHVLAHVTTHRGDRLSRTIRGCFAAALCVVVASCSAPQSAEIITPPVPKAAAAAPKVLTLDGFGYTSLEEPVPDMSGYQLTYVDLSTGAHIGSANERDLRSALSLIKLYIGHYVFLHGTSSDQRLAVTMITQSDDAAADELYSRYPESIEWVAENYHLDSTVADYRWGYSLTSTYDVAYFLAQLLLNEPHAKVLYAMTEASQVASDGTTQDFGTAILPRVLGSKWAWSDDEQLHASASYGENFVAVAAVNGDAETLTDLVRYQLLGEGDAALN